MEITILESALILAPLTALALVILGYRGKLHFGITLCAGIVSIMIAFAAVALVYLHLFNLSLLWALPLAVLMDFAAQNAARVRDGGRGGPCHAFHTVCRPARLQLDLLITPKRMIL